MATTTDCTPILPIASQHFCCRHCGHDVALIEELGGDLSYECQNGACGWAGSVDCPEALGFKVAAEAELLSYAHEWDAARDAAIADLASFAAGWDAWAEALRAEHEPEPEPPAPSAAQRKAQYHLAGQLAIRKMGNAYLVPSGTRAGVIHRVEAGRCSCEASQHGRSCWHLEAVALLESGVSIAA